MKNKNSIYLLLAIVAVALVLMAVMAPVAMGLAIFSSQGGSAPAATSSQAPTAAYGNYVNPFGKGNGDWIAARTDMGVDWCVRKNEPILAIGNADVTFSSQSVGWPGGGFIAYRLLDGDHKGNIIFVAEQIRDLAKVGAHVTAGQRIGTAIANGSCATEWGFNSSPHNDLPRAYPCYNEGDETNSGKEMARFFKRLGAKPEMDPGAGPDFPTGPLC